jgi:hypothetical protein
MLKRRFHVLHDSAGVGGAAGAGGGEETGGTADGGGTGAAGAGSDNAAASGNGGGAGSALAAGAPAAGGADGGAGAVAAAAGAAAGGVVNVPEKFIVKTASGETDHAATALKVSEAYGHLEKRFGGGDAPPADATSYKVNVPEALGEKIKAEELASNSGFKDFMAKAHGVGLTQKQFDVVTADFLERSLALKEAGPVLDQASCEADLRQAEGWKSDGEYKAQVGRAWHAGQSIFGKDFEGIVKDYGNDARLIRGLASIGREMQEDMSASPEAQAQIQDSLETLMNSPSYLNGNDPQHTATMAKVTALTQQIAGNKTVTQGKTHSFKTG